MFCKYHKVLFLFLFFNFLWISFALTACSSSKTSTSGPTDKNSSSSKTVRPNEPDLHLPEASAASVIGQEPLLIDVSHLDQGYVMACYSGSSQKANVQLIGPDEIEYKYFIKPEDGYVTLPLTSGSGTYSVKTYENISGTQYASLYTESIEVTLENDYIPYLYPNQYVNFSKDSKIVSAAQDIVKNDTSNLDAVSSIYHYVIENVTYDTDKAETVENGYLPDVDETLESKKGICFDYAALMTSMLRSQGIPTKLQIGYAGEVYHAWISVYIKDTGWIDDIIQFDGKNWERMDPTFASANHNSKKILNYIGDGDNYITRYTR